MRLRKVSQIAIAAVLAVAGMNVALACKPIYEPVSIGTGVHCVTQSFTSLGVPAITAIGTGVEDVEVDLQGFVLSASDHVIQVSNVRSFTIRNGTLHGFLPANEDGIFIENTGAVVINNVEIRDVYHGIRLSGVTDFSIEENRISNSLAIGIEVDGAASVLPIGGMIQANAVLNSAAAGIRVHDNHADVNVRNNVVRLVYQGPGILLEAGETCTVESNTVGGAVLDGIKLQSMTDCSLRDNRSRRNNQNGISLTASDDTVLEGNIAVRNGNNGLAVNGARTTIIGNRLMRNGLGGLWFRPGSVDSFFRDNVGLNNTTPPGGCAPPPCAGLSAPDFCDDGVANVSGGGNSMPGPPTC